MVLGGLIFHDEPGVVIKREIPADVHWFDASILCFVFASVPVVALVLRHSRLLLGAVSLLELDVDGMSVLLANGEANAHSVFPPLVPEIEEQMAEFFLKSLVEVEVDEGVIDVGTLGKEGGEHKASGGHVAVPFVENEKEGHNCIRGPGDHKTQADAEKHLEEDTNKDHVRST